jgi:uncharacterized membrane protein
MAQTRARIARHPIHPMLVVFPIGLWVTALVFDVVYAFTGNPLWRTLAFWNLVGGIVGALAAAVPGLIDYSEMTGRARRIANWHMALNLGVTALFVVNVLLRTTWGSRFIDGNSWIPLALSVIGNAVLGVSGWLGGEMVYVERVGVEDPPDRGLNSARRRVG